MCYGYLFIIILMCEVVRFKLIVVRWYYSSEGYMDV